MAKNEYTLERKLAGSDIKKEDFDSQPLSTQEMQSIQQVANLILQSLAGSPNAPAGYDAASVKRLSEDLNRSRSTLDADARIKIANMYGAFLGNALIASNREANGTWVRLRNGDVAIRFEKTKDGTSNFALPITRVFKHIDDGEIHSIYSFFLSISDILRAGGPGGNVAPAKAGGGAAGDAARQTGSHSQVQIGQAANGSDLVLALPQALCCNCGTQDNLNPIASPMHHRRMLDGREIRFALDLPYCRACYSTAGRFPKSIGFKAFATFIAYSVFIFLVLIPLGNYAIVAKHGGVLLILFTLLVIGVFYWIRKPKGPQTTVYQPVKLADISLESGGIRQIRLKFSNPSYLREFSKLNRNLIGKGTVKAI